MIFFSGTSLHAPQYTPFPVPPYPLFIPASSPAKESFKRNKNKIKIQNKTNKCFAPPSFLPLHHLFIHFSGVGSSLLSCSRPFYPNSFICKCLLCNMLLVWFKISDFWYTTNTGPSPKLLSDILMLP